MGVVFKSGRVPERVEFRSFIDGSYREVKKLKPVSSFVYVSPAAVFTPPPIVAKGYLIVIIAGLTLISAAFLEKFLAKNGQTDWAETVNDSIGNAIPYAFIIGLILFVLKNPVLKW